MFGVRKLRVVALVSVMVLTSVSCGTTGLKDAEPIDVGQIKSSSGSVRNSLVFGEMRVDIPSGWRFIALSDEQRDVNYLFSFQDELGSSQVFGNVQYVNVGDAALRSVCDWLTEVSTYADFRTIHTTRIDGSAAYILIGDSKDSQRDWHMAVIPEQQDVVCIQLSSPEGYLDQYPKDVYSVFSSYRFPAEEQYGRWLPNGVSFKTDDVSWKWWDDFASGEGFYIIQEINDYILALGIGETELDTAEDIIRQWIEGEIPLDIPLRSTTMNIGGRKVTAKGMGISNHKDTAKIGYLIQVDGRRYQLYIAVSRKLLDGDPKALHEFPQVEKVLRENVFLK